MWKRTSLMGAALVMVWAVGLRAGAAERPNILFLFADDQRADTIGAWGNEHIRTPHIDRLAERGFSFRANYCFGGDSGAVCIPSRAMVHSGRHYFAVDHQMTGARTLGEALRQNGYATFGTGKWHNGVGSFARSFERGEAVMFGGMSGHFGAPIADVVEGQVVNRRSGEGHTSEVYAEAAIRFMEGRAGDERPFFCYVAFQAPHDPRDAPWRNRQEYDRRLPPLPENFMPVHPFDNGWIKVRDEDLAGWPREPGVVRQQLAEYYALVTHMDEQIGRVLAAVEESGHGGNTVIVYAADHGLAMGSHGLLGKQNLYEHSMRCPLIFAGPGVRAGGSSEALTYLLDIYPTLCELAGIETPEGLFGESLAGVWRGEREGVRETLFTSYQDAMRAVRDERWKLIRYPRINFTQLFDLRSDPGEMKNRAGEAGQAERVEKMMGLLREWQARVGDGQGLSTAEPASMEVDLSGYRREPDRWQPEWVVRKYFE